MLQAPDGTGNPARATCTVPCTTDDDCAGATIGPASDGQCGTRFVCAVVTATGDDTARCRTFCVCQDDLRCGFNADAPPGRSAADPAPRVMTPPACPNPSPPPSCG